MTKPIHVTPAGDACLTPMEARMMAVGARYDRPNMLASAAFFGALSWALVGVVALAAWLVILWVAS